MRVAESPKNPVYGGLAQQGRARCLPGLSTEASSTLLLWLHQKELWPPFSHLTFSTIRCISRCSGVRRLRKSCICRWSWFFCRSAVRAVSSASASRARSSCSWPSFSILPRSQVELGGLKRRVNEASVQNDSFLNQTACSVLGK